MTSRQYRYWLASATMLSTAALMGVQDAAAQSLAIEEITVTTRKRAESLQDIPFTVTAFTSEMIDRQGIRSIDDVARLVPGLIFDKGFAPQDTRPSIRGLPATRGRPPVGILLDGIDTSSQAITTGGGGNLMNLRLVDVERIEVVKGPQSALYGRSAFGGAINYITKKPGDEFEGQVYADVGDHGQAEISGSIAGPISDSVGVRVNVAYAQHDGFYQNSISGTDVGGFDSLGAAFAIVLKPSEDLTINARVAYSEDDGEIRARGTLGGSTFIAAPANGLGLTGAFNPPFAELEFGPGITVQSSLDPFTGEEFAGSTQDSLLMSLVFDYSITDTVTFSSWTGYNDAETNQDFDSDGRGAPFGFSFFPAPGGINELLSRSTIIDFFTSTKQFSQEIRIGDLESDGFRWAVGGQYWDEDVDQLDRSTATVDFTGLASAGLNLALNGPIEPGPAGRDTRHWSVYGHVEYDISDQLTLSAEARYSDEHQEYLINDSDGNAFGSPFFGVIPYSPNNVLTAEADDDFFTPRVSLEYQMDDDVLMYASVSKGVKPGGISTIVVSGTLDTKRFTPETLWNYEIGTKSTWADGRVQLNGAIFYMDYTDKQVTTQETDPNSPVGLIVVTRNAGSAEVPGLEIDAAFAPADNLNISVSYTYLDAKYTDFVFNTASGNDVVRGGNCTVVNVNGTDTCSVDLSGNAMERSAKHSLVGTIAFDTPLTDGIDFLAEVSAQYQGDRWLAHWNRWTLGSHINVDARIGVEGENWSIIGYADNLFNEDTVKSAQENFDLFTFGTALQIFAPDKRQIGARLSYNF